MIEGLVVFSIAIGVPLVAFICEYIKGRKE